MAVAKRICLVSSLPPRKVTMNCFHFHRNERQNDFMTLDAAEENAVHVREIPIQLNDNNRQSFPHSRKTFWLLFFFVYLSSVEFRMKLSLSLNIITK